MAAAELVSALHAKVDGLADIDAAVDRITAAVRDELEAELEREARDLARDAATNARVDTGDLAGSIAPERVGLTATVAPRPGRSKVSPKQLAIKANVNEYGRSRDPGRPFMVPAAELSRRRWPKRAAEALERAAGR